MMDADEALELVKSGATLLLLDVPQYTLIGIDTQVFSVGPAFKGIKMIPPGVHFVFYSSSTRDGKEFSPITGFFIDAGYSQVVVRMWDQQEERLIKVPEEEEERYRQAVRSFEFDKHLGPYDLSLYADWKRLSNYITKSTIERLGFIEMDSCGCLRFQCSVVSHVFHVALLMFKPIGGEITVTYEHGMLKNTCKSAMERVLDEQLRNSKFSSPAEKHPKRGCYYTPIPRIIKRKGIESEQLTSLNLDKASTELLETLLVKDYGGSEESLLGELQFAFIAFLMGQSLEAFMQWKSLVSLLLGCTEANHSSCQSTVCKLEELNA
ncbi:hypothetical protein Goklo_013459 [Gossypium klotzschianum]|uniref:Protein AAR2 homolog n=1 Tax=Gossypium klotzschianum TaxID=34286 RepID=A0A7J8U4L0_9ROSI|nr:hypothetical protein [Gossypium klotzschianum]